MKYILIFVFVLSGCHKCPGKSGYSAYCESQDQYYQQHKNDK